MEKIFKYLIDHATKKKQQKQQQQQQNKYRYRYLIKKISLMKSKNFATYVKKNLILIKMIKMHLNYIIKSEIVVIIWKTLEGLHLQIKIKKKNKRNSCSVS